MSLSFGGDNDSSALKHLSCLHMVFFFDDELCLAYVWKVTVFRTYSRYVIPPIFDVFKHPPPPPPP
ncbi:MAG: hypothetical protein MJE68_22200, partial [Proteobacteria bacterium]|nr:hypothetical protein [Pseudomonadota bacterium]